MRGKAKLRLIARRDSGPGGKREPEEREAWVEAPVAKGWIAAFRIVAKDSVPMLAEVRLLPDGEGRSAGGWSGLAKDVPEGGVPARALRHIRLEDALDLFSEYLENFGRGEAGANVLARFGFSPPSPVQRRPGRAGRGDDYYLTWAAAYADLIASGNQRPVRALSLHPPVPYREAPRRVSEHTVRDVLREARRRELLTPAPPGKPGGRLTKKALSAALKLEAPSDLGRSADH